MSDDKGIIELKLKQEGEDQPHVTLPTPLNHWSLTVSPHGAAVLRRVVRVAPVHRRPW